MKNYNAVLRKCKLFDGISESQYHAMCTCINAKYKKYAKGEIIMLTGDDVRGIGVVLNGFVKIVNVFRDGNETIDAMLGGGEIFAEAIVCAGIENSPVTVVAVQDTEVMFIDYKKVIMSCDSSCDFHTKLIKNMLSIIAKKNLMQKEKISIISNYSMRERILTYLEFQNRKYGFSGKFSIPYNRDELAEYLCVNRSSMSTELSKMQREGIIKYHKNNFEILI